jgi:hypothetical protein
LSKLEAAAEEIEHLKIEGYTIDYLAKLRPAVRVASRAACPLLGHRRGKRQ